jgi:hypothetical protein
MSEEYNNDKESSENLDFMKMILYRKFSNEKPQLSRFGRAAAAAAVNNVENRNCSDCKFIEEG